MNKSVEELKSNKYREKLVVHTLAGVVGVIGCSLFIWELGWVAFIGIFLMFFSNNIGQKL